METIIETVPGRMPGDGPQGRATEGAWIPAPEAIGVPVEGEETPTEDMADDYNRGNLEGVPIAQDDLRAAFERSMRETGRTSSFIARRALVRYLYGDESADTLIERQTGPTATIPAVLMFRVPREVSERLAEVAAERRMAKSEIMRAALADYLGIEYVEQASAARHQREDQIFSLLADGYSFSEIGGVVGVSKQAAHATFTKACAERGLDAAKLLSESYDASARRKATEAVEAAEIRKIEAEAARERARIELEARQDEMMVRAENHSIADLAEMYGVSKPTVSNYLRDARARRDARQAGETAAAVVAAPAKAKRPRPKRA